MSDEAGGAKSTRPVTIFRRSSLPVRVKDGGSRVEIKHSAESVFGESLNSPKALGVTVALETAHATPSRLGRLRAALPMNRQFRGVPGEPPFSLAETGHSKRHKRTGPRSSRPAAGPRYLQTAFAQTGGTAISSGQDPGQVPYPLDI